MSDVTSSEGTLRNQAMIGLPRMRIPAVTWVAAAACGARAARARHAERTQKGV
jgi:hypothetical protein